MRYETMLDAFLSAGRFLSHLPSRDTVSWQFDAAARELLLLPVRSISRPSALTCNVPLVDAVALPCQPGTPVALANYTLQPIERVTFELQVDRAIAGIESVRHGQLKFAQPSPGRVRWSMPLDASDWVKVVVAE